MRKQYLFTLLILLGIQFTHCVSAQTVNLTPFATLSGTTENERLGTVLRKANISGDSKPELFIGAPGYSNQAQTNLGRIYLLSLPVESDTSLSGEQVILQGSSAQDNVGRFFNLGDFNADNVIDIVTWNPDAQNEQGEVRVFFGPFTPGVIRLSTTADIVINGNGKELMGSSVAVVPQQTGDALLVGASGYDNFTGRVYFFDKIAQGGTFTGSDATFRFTGNIRFDLFGATVEYIGDVNGDNQIDFAISSTKHTNDLTLQGAIYLFFGPFDQTDYSLSDAAVTLFGRTANTLWAGKIFRHNDLNNDGFDDFSVGSDGDGAGVLALFYGRETWADSITIGEVTQGANAHTIFTLADANRAGFGFSVDFTGDYNFDGTRDFLWGAPYAGGNMGRVYVSNQNGGSLVSLTESLTNADGFFGTQVLRLGSINTLEIDPYGVDDLVASAPGAFSTAKWGSIRTGALTFYTGKLNPPSSSMAVNAGSGISEIGDSARVAITSTKGSRPIALSRIYITTQQRGQFPTLDSLDLPVGNTATTNRWFKLNKAGSVTLTHYVRDDFNIESSSMLTLHFAARPEPFNLLTSFNEVIRIEGDRTQIISFESEASADTNGAGLQYELLFSADDGAFTGGGNLNLIQTSNSPRFSLTYQELNTYLVNHGFLNLNVENEIYWSIRASNRINGINLFTRLAENGPRKLPFIRKGLDPFFNLTTGTDRFLNIEGLDTDYFEFKWTSLISENPNAIVDYRFVLVKDTTKSGIENPVIREYADAAENNTYRIFYDDLTFILQRENVFDLAREDTVHWFYTVEAIIDGDEENPWLAHQGFKKADIRYTILVNSIEEENEVLSDVPSELEIYPNFPNPFNPTTQLKFAIPEANSVKIIVFNLLGQVVYTWNSSGPLRAGFHEHTINGQNWSSGIYIYQIQVGTHRLTGKMSLVK